MYIGIQHGISNYEVKKQRLLFFWILLATFVSWACFFFFATEEKDETRKIRGKLFLLFDGLFC